MFSWGERVESKLFGVGVVEGYTHCNLIMNVVFKKDNEPVCASYFRDGRLIDWHWYEGEDGEPVTVIDYEGKTPDLSY